MEDKITVVGGGLQWRIRLQWLVADYSGGHDYSGWRRTTVEEDKITMVGSGLQWWMTKLQWFVADYSGG